MAMIGGTYMTMTVSDEEHAKLKSTFSDDLDKVYTRIVMERRNIYIQGLLIGLFLSVVVIQTSKTKMRYGHRIFLAFAITLFTAMVYYMLTPKSDYMLNHLKSAEHNRAWLQMYRNMQNRYMFGIILGALASIPIAHSICA
jgi:uncharacterized protein YacL